MKRAYHSRHDATDESLAERRILSGQRKEAEDLKPFTLQTPTFTTLKPASVSTKRMPGGVAATDSQVADGGIREKDVVDLHSAPEAQRSRVVGVHRHAGGNNEAAWC